jgi:hypothetical protein
VEGSEKWGVKESEIQGIKARISGEMCGLSWIHSYVVCIWITVQSVVSPLFVCIFYFLLCPKY